MPFVIQKFDKIDLINRKISYLSISYIPIGNDFINTFLKNPDGTWNKPLESVFLLKRPGRASAREKMRQSTS
jgi:hypothetical protein